MKEVGLTMKADYGATSNEFHYCCMCNCVASYPGPRAERRRGPGDTWQNSHMCSVSIIA